MKQVFIGGIADAPTAAATEYAPLFAGSSSNTWAATEWWRNYRLGVGGKLSTFQVSIDTAPGAGKSVVFTIRKNSADTAAVVTISDTATTGSYTGAAITYAAGDTITVKSTQVNTPTLFTYARWSILYEGDTAKMSTMMGGTGSAWGVTAAPPYYLPASGGYTPNATITWRQSLVAINGTIKSFYYAQNGAADAGVTYAVSIYKNGAIQASSTITYVAATGLYQSVTGLSIDIAPGDFLSIGCSITGTQTNQRGPNGWGLGIEADVEGESNVCGMAYTLNSTAGSYQYAYMTNQSAVAPSATETQRQMIGGSSILVELSNFYVRVLTAVAAGTSRTINLRINGADGNQTVLFNGVNGAQTDSTHTDLINSFDTVDIQATCSGAPATGVAQYAFKMIEKVYDLNIDVYDRVYTAEGSLFPPTAELIDQYLDFNSAYSQYSGSSVAYLGQSFITPSGVAHRINSIWTATATSGSPTGTHYAVLYKMGGTIGVDSKPVGVVLATSDGNDVSTYDTNYTYRRHSFSGDNRIILTPDTYYVFVHYYTGGDATNKIMSAMDTTTPTHVGNLCYSANGSSFGAVAGYDEAFKMYGTVDLPEVVSDPQISVGDDISIIENIESSGDLSDIIVSDDIIVSEDYTVLLLTDIYEYYVVITEIISVEDSSDIFFLEYNAEAVDNISITESVEYIIPYLGDINIHDDINTTENFTTAYTVKAFDGKTVSRWAYIESSAGRSIARDSTGKIYAVYIMYGTTYSNYEVWISQSIDGGKTWPGGVYEKMIYRISSGSCFSPKIAIDSADNIYVSWLGKGAFTNPTVQNVVMKKGTYANLHTQLRIDVTDSPVAQANATIAIDSYDNLHIVASGLGYGTNSGLYQITYRKYLSTGTFESNIINLTDEPNSQYVPDIVIDRFNNLHLAWYGIYSGEATRLKIRYLKYTESDHSWGDIDSSLIPNGTNQSGYFPSLALDSNDKIHIAYYHNNFIKYSNLKTGSWETPTNLLDTTAVTVSVSRQSIALDKQDNIYVAAEGAYGSIFDMIMCKYRDGAWQTPKNYAYPTNFQTKPNLMFATHPMQHKQSNIPLLGTLGVWVDSTSPTTTSNSGDIMFHSDIDLEFQNDIYINVHDHVNVTENNEFFLLQIYIQNIYDSVTMYEGTSLSEGPLSPTTTVNIENIELADSFDDSNRTGSLSPFYGGGIKFVGETFYNTNSAYLDSITFYNSKTGTPTGTIQYELYAMTGTPGVDGRPTGSVLATSDTYDISGSMGLVNIQFSGAQKIILTADTWYAILINYTNVAGVSGVSYMGIGYADGLVPSKNFFYSTYGSSWTLSTTWDAIFYVYTKNINDIAWTNPDNIQVSDDTYATAVLPEVTVDSWDTLDPPNWTNLFTCRQGSRQYRGQTFTSDTPVTLDRAVFPLTKTGSPVGNLYVKIYHMSGTYGTSGIPTGAPLAISDPIDGSTVVTDNGSYNFEYMQFLFTGLNRIRLAGGTYYVVVLDIQAGDANNNYFNVPNDIYGGHDGNVANSEDGISWTASGTSADFYVYGVSDSQYLKATNFGFNIPVDKTIIGIKVDIEEKTDGIVNNSIVKLIKSDGTINSINRGGTNLDASDTYITYGSPLDIWGTAWTPADINNTNFGVVFTASGIGTASVDHVRITVYYSTMRPDVLMAANEVSVYESISITEEAGIIVNIPEFIPLSVSDSISITDINTVSMEMLGDINTVDLINITDYFYPGISIDVSDSINITESHSIFFLNWVIDTFDSINITENLNKNNDLSLSTSDNLSIYDTATVKIFLLGDINIFDSLDITEGPAATGTIYNYTANAGTVDTIASEGGDAAGWINIDNVKVSDDTYTSANTGFLGQAIITTNKLKLTNFDFSAIPNGATVTGIEVNIERKSSHDTALDYCVDDLILLNTASDTQSPSPRVDNITKWTTTDSIVTYGSDTDKWGLDLKIEDIKSPNFGVRFAADISNGTQSVSAYVDNISITVYYGLISVPKVEERSFVSVNSPINITENVSREQTLGDIYIVDNVNIIDSSVVVRNHTISVSDSISIIESNTAFIPEYFLSVFDSVTISENNTTRTQLGDIIVFDAVNITSFSVAETPYIINTHDYLFMIGEIATFDDPNVSFDDILVSYGGFYSDYVKIELRSSINLVDVININELINTSPSITSINVNDLINISENLAEVRNLVVSVYDSLNISESITQSISNPNISVSDIINISENLAEVRNLALSIFDSISISEVIVQTISISNVYVFDIINIVENNIEAISLVIYEVDNISILEYWQIKTDDLTINIINSLVISEEVSIENPLCYGNVYDSVNIIEDITTSITDSYIFISDSIIITDNLSGAADLTISVEDSITISENIDSEQRININITENVIISEMVTIESFRFSPSIKKPQGSGHSIGNPSGSIKSIGRPNGGISSIRRPIGAGNKIGTPYGSVKSVGRPRGSVD